MGNNEQEREINLADMIWTICLKWRVLLVSAVIFAVLAGGYSCLNSMRSRERSDDSDPQLSNIELLEDSQDRVNQYLQYVKILEDQFAYNENAPFMQLNALGFYVGRVSYYVDNHFQDEQPDNSEFGNMKAIITSYLAELRSEGFISELYSLMGGSADNSAYLLELVDTANQYGGAVFSQNANIAAALDNGSNTMTISVYGAEEAACRELLQLVKKTIEGKRDSVAGRIGEHDIILIEDACNYVSDIQLLTYQKGKMDWVTTSQTAVKNLEGQLSEQEMLYIQQLETSQEVEGSAEDEGNEPQQNTVTFSAADINVKYVAIGFVGGLILAGFVIILLYVLNNRLRLADDVEALYGVKLFCRMVPDEERKKKIFDFVDDFLIKLRNINQHSFTPEEAISMAAAGIRISARNAKTTKIYATGSNMGPKEKAVIENLAEELKKTGVELIAGNPILYDAEAMEHAAEVGNLVLVERAGVSMYDEVSNELETCSYQGIKILGMVMMG